MSTVITPRAHARRALITHRQTQHTQTHRRSAYLPFKCCNAAAVQEVASASTPSMEEKLAWVCPAWIPWSSIVNGTYSTACYCYIEGEGREKRGKEGGGFSYLPKFPALWMAFPSTHIHTYTHTHTPLSSAVRTYSAQRALYLQRRSTFQKLIFLRTLTHPRGTRACSACALRQQRICNCAYACRRRARV